jgi:hypothetical protein
MTRRQETQQKPRGSRGSSPLAHRTVNSQSREREPVRRPRFRDGVRTRKAREGRVYARRRRYLSARAVISVIALASLVVPGVVAVIAAAVSAF